MCAVSFTKVVFGMVLRLYTDPSILPRGVAHVPMLTPFLGRIDPPESPEAARFDRYMQVGPSIYGMSSLPDADVAVLPFGWEAVLADPALLDTASRFADRVRAAGKRILVFCESDSSAPVPIDGALVYRTSLYRATRGANEQAMPGWSGDLLANHFHGRLSPRPWSSMPVVGFRGHVPRESRTLARDIIEGVRQTLGRAHNSEPASFAERRIHAAARQTAVRALQGSDVVTPAIIREVAFMGGSLRRDGSIDWSLLAEKRAAYAEHIAACDYVLCVRGGGNFSYRLYETLCLGRGPLFIDTDCVLPLEQFVDIGRACVTVDVSDIAQLGERLRAFHDALAPEDFIGLQRDARACWEQWLSPEGFFSALARVTG
jgi:hypothetical protein